MISELELLFDSNENYELIRGNQRISMLLQNSYKYRTDLKSLIPSETGL